MIGRLLAKIRTDKNVTKTEIARETGINIGHLTHIEKEERNPSHKTLKLIADALDVPLQPLTYAYDRKLTEEQIDYLAVNHINYSSIPIIDSIIGYSNCPKEVGRCSFIMRSFDSVMEPKINKSDFIYIELNAPLNSKDYGLFQLENQLLIRKFIVRKNDIVLRAESNAVDDIIINKNTDFYILGKILGKNNTTMSEFIAF